MCAIAGVLDVDGRPVDVKEAERMLEPMAHRGPDDRGVWSAGPLALGHLRLAILDPSPRAAQPLLCGDDTGVLVYNGEVYDFPALRRELEREGARFRTRSDAEVVLEALHRWGPEAAIPRFDGMFAFAYLDRRDGSLWLARDRLGVKPLYVSWRGAKLVFASEIKGLLAHPDVSTEPDLHHLTLQLLRGRLVGRRTPFRGIDALEAGTWWRVGPGGVERRRWFDPVRDLDVERVVRARSDPPEVAARAFASAMTESVHLHLASDVPLAAACSGGVDSSLVCALALRERPDLVGYVVGSEGESRDAEFAEQVGRHLGLPLRRIQLDRWTYARLAPEATWHHEHPLPLPASTGLLGLARACRDDGVKVILTGEGADELFGGYAWHRLTHRHWRKQRRGARRGIPGLRRSRPVPLPEAALRADALDRTLAAPVDVDTELRVRTLLERLAPIEPLEDRVFLAHCIDDLSWQLGPLLQHHDRMGMAASIEMRVPFLENALIDLALHLPVGAKIRARDGRGGGKGVVKREALRWLPPDVVHATKRGFPMPRAASGLARDLVRGGALAEVLGWTRAETEAQLAVAAASARQRFHLTAFEVWARVFLRREPPLSPALVRSLQANAP